MDRMLLSMKDIGGSFKTRLKGASRLLVCCEQATSNKISMGALGISLTESLVCFSAGLGLEH